MILFFSSLISYFYGRYISEVIMQYIKYVILTLESVFKKSDLSEVGLKVKFKARF